MQIFTQVPQKSMLLISVLSCAVFYAQNRGGISGRIVDEDNLPLVGATVYLNNREVPSVVDEDGRYLITNVEEGEHVLRVNYIGYLSVNQNVSVQKDVVARYDIVLRNKVREIEKVTVKGTSGGILRALNQQKNADKIVNVISAEQVGAFPDPNVGDALKRISGIHVQYDQGEAKLVSVRGTDPSKSTVSINGAQMSGTGDSRAIPIDAIPADMVQAIELSKTFTADMDGDAVGGNINLVTRKAPYKQRMSFTGATGYSFLTQQPQYNGNIIYGDRYIKDKLGVIASASIYSQSLGSNQYNSPWQKTNLGDTEYFIPEYFNIEQTFMDRQRQSYTLGLDYNFNEKHQISFTGIYNDYKDWRSRYTLRIDDIGGDYKENWKKTPGFEDVEIFTDKDDYTASGAQVKVLDEDNNGVDDISGKMYVDFDPLRPAFYPELERHVYAGANKNGGELEHTKIINGALEGKHIFGNVVADWSASWVSTNADRPADRDFELQSSNEKTVVMDYSDPRYINSSSGFTIDRLQEIVVGKNSKELAKVDTWELDGFKAKETKSKAEQGLFALNVQLPIIEGDNGNTLKFGGKARLMNKDRQILGRVKVKPADDPNMPGTMNWSWMWNDFANNMQDISSGFHNSRYTVGNSVTSAWVASQNIVPYGTTDRWQTVTVYTNEMVDGYSATENVYAGYLMSTQKFGDQWTFIAGLRGEYTDMSYTGTEYVRRAEVFKDVSVSKNYMSYLPSFYARYAPEKNLIFRLAYSKTISRPDYRNLVPYTKSDIGTPSLAFGNPELKPTNSHNFDLLGEYYLGSIGLISGGLYMKNIQDFGTVYYYDIPWAEAKQYFPTAAEVQANPNADPISVADYIKRLKKAEGKKVSAQMPVNGGNANLYGVEVAVQRNLDFLGSFMKRFSVYANYTHNWVDNKDDLFRLPGTAENILNLSLSYETQKINARVSYNYTSDFLIGTGATSEDDVYYDRVRYLDANIDYFLNDKITIFATANNLLGQSQRQYQWKEDYTYFNLENGTRIQLGLKITPFK